MFKPSMGVLSKFNKETKIYALTPGLPNINWKKLTHRCRQKISSFGNEKGFVRVNTPDGRQYFYKDNGADILGVAHLDWVAPPVHTPLLKLSYDHRFFCPTLDDRLGVYTLLDYLPMKNIKYDILLTDGEERMESTARFFKSPAGKKYRWMFMFDRAGTDVVLYQYDAFVTSIALEEAGWKLGKNFTYSCICDLEHLRCSGFNFGVGYYGQHTLNSFMSRNDYLENMRKFIRFYKRNQNESFPYIPVYNIYSRETGFDFISTQNRGEPEGTFSGDAIDVIETMAKDYEQNGYGMPEFIYPRDFRDKVMDYSKYKSDQEYAKQIESQFKQPTLFDTNPKSDKINGSIERHEVKKDKSENKSQMRVLNMPLIRDVKIKPSEDSLNYQHKVAAVNESGKTKSDEILDNRKDVSVTVAHVQDNESKEFLREMAQVSKDQKTPLGLGECLRCQKATEIYLGDTVILCPECEKDLEAKDNKQISEANVRSETTFIAFEKIGANNGTYQKDKDGKWRWNFVPKQKPATVGFDVIKAGH